VIHVKNSSRAVEEAVALRAAAHPGVVGLVDSNSAVLHTQLVEGRPLADTRPLTAEEAAGLAAAIATTLADLHDLGIVHGGVDATHVIVTDEGRPVLCSLGRGGEPADDVAALGRLVTEMLARRPPERPAPGGWRERRRRLGPMLAPPAAQALGALATEASGTDPARRPSARALAAAISQHIPSACLPRPEAMAASAPRLDPKGPARWWPRRWPRRWPRLRPRTVAAAMASVVVVLGMAILVMPPWAGPQRASPAQPPPAAAPARVHPDAGSGHLTDGVLTVDGIRYRVGQAGDAVAIGDWACSGRPTPVILRPSSGELFSFDEWAEPGRDVNARPLGRVKHATGVRAAPLAGGSCHELEVLRSQGPPTRLEVTP
jgi:hypothetical protein